MDDERRAAFRAALGAWAAQYDAAAPEPPVRLVLVRDVAASDDPAAPLVPSEAVVTAADRFRIRR